MSFPSPEWGLVGPSSLPLGTRLVSPALPEQGPSSRCIGPGIGLLVPLAFPISHTSTLYISGSQEVGTSCLG